jgi:CRISPR-associated endoribonuclease Cas6
MLTSAVIRFTPEESCALPASTGNYVHGLFLTLVKSQDSALAESLHDDDRAKPFTVSPVFGDLVPLGRGNNSLIPGKNYWMRFTLLDDTLSGVMLPALTQAKGETFMLGGRTMRVTEVCLDSASDDWAGMSSHEQIYNRYIVRQEGICSRLSLHFLTPTTFRKDRHNIILPQPATVFYSTLEKWNTLSGLPLDDAGFLDWLNHSCVVSRYEIKTRMWDFDKYKYIGMVGEVEFTDLSKEETVWCALWNMLADYLFWAGAGAKATMGMGMARVMR